MTVIDEPLVKRWALTWNGRSWTEDDLTGAHTALVVLMSNSDTWEILDPFRGPVTLMQLLAAFISIEDQRDPLEVLAELGRQPAKLLFAAVTLD